MENVAETTGLGLGVHVTINPADAQCYFVTDGQKDIAACFDRMTSRVMAALKFDWVGNSPNLADCWQHGGTLTISKIYPDQATGKFDYQGTKGQKLEWEMVPMGELFVEEGTVPGDSPQRFRRGRHHLASDGRWAATSCGSAAASAFSTGEELRPRGFRQFNKDCPPSIRHRIDDDHWQVVFDKIVSPAMRSASRRTAISSA